MQAGSSPAQTESASGLQGEKSWKVRTVPKGREEAQRGKEMAWGKGRLVAGRQVWRAHREGVARSNGTCFSAMVWSHPVGCGIYCKYFAINSGKILNFVSTWKIWRWLPTTVIFRGFKPCPVPRTGKEGGELFEKLFDYYSQDLPPDIPKVCWEGAAYFKNNSPSKPQKPMWMSPCLASSVVGFLECK